MSNYFSFALTGDIISRVIPRDKQFDKYSPFSYYAASMPNAPTSLILASTSPRRRELVMLFDRAFTFLSADVDEAPRGGEPPDALVSRLSRAKAETCPEPFLRHASRKLRRRISARQFPDSLVVAADTVVALDATILGKPKDSADAARMLRLLRNRAHVVYSGLTVTRGTRQLTQVATTTVWMRDYTDAEIAAYVASGDPLDKAAAYAIQDDAFRPVARIDGCHANVMGLPLCHLYRALREFGIDVNKPDRACQAHLQIVCPVARDILSQSGNQESGNQAIRQSGIRQFGNSAKLTLGNSPAVLGVRETAARLPSTQEKKRVLRYCAIWHEDVFPDY